MSWLEIQRWLTSVLLCDVSALFNWRSVGPNEARALVSDLRRADLCHPFSPLSSNHIIQQLVSWLKQLVNIYYTDYVW